MRWSNELMEGNSGFGIPCAYHGLIRGFLGSPESPILSVLVVGVRRCNDPRDPSHSATESSSVGSCPTPDYMPGTGDELHVHNRPYLIPRGVPGEYTAFPPPRILTGWDDGPIHHCLNSQCPPTSAIPHSGLLAGCLDSGGAGREWWLLWMDFSGSKRQERQVESLN